MEREELEKLYEELGYNKVDELYNYSCLLTSGFNKKQAYNLIGLLNDLWLDDENNYSVSKLSDMLYNVYDDIDTDKLTTREILEKMYEEEL